jgi:hypothetical protein
VEKVGWDRGENVLDRRRRLWDIDNRKKQWGRDNMWRNWIEAVHGKRG